MTVQDAVNEIVAKLQRLDDKQLMATGRTLAQADLTWEEWVKEITVRNAYLLADGPSQDVLDAIGAVVIAFKLKLAEAEETRVESGAEAA